VVDGVGAGDGRAEARGVRDVSGDERGAERPQGRRPTGAANQAADFDPVARQPLDEMTADEARRTRHQSPDHSFLSARGNKAGVLARAFKHSPKDPVKRRAAPEESEGRRVRNARGRR
jgi:hypothetical protein